MDIVYHIILGGVIGWLASIVMKTDSQMGLVFNVVVGVVGAALAGFLAPRLGIAAGGLPGSLLVAFGGAVLVIVILKGLKVLK